MNRREFLAWTGMGAIGLAARAARSAATAPARAAGRMNLLIIHTDEHNYRTLGCHRRLLPAGQALVWGGQASLDTPHIDSIAADGCVCTKFYANTPVCSPSRSSFVTGRYPQNTPVTTNNIPMDDGRVTFAEVLRRAGYATGYAGKWHLDGPPKPGWAPRRHFGFADNRFLFNRGHWKQLEQTPDGPRVKTRNAQGQPTYAVAGADATSFTTDFLADRTIEFLRAHKDEPFCHMVSIPDPHGPNTVRPPYDTMFDGLTFQDPPTMHKPDAAVPRWAPRQAARLVPRQMRLYFGMVKCIDDSVGRILAALKEANLADRTIVVFTSDHGDLCGEHGRHNKGVPYETSAGVPFVIRAPGTIPPGTVVREALSCVDFTPTILALMGLAAPPGAEGRDATALLTTGRSPAGWEDVAFLRSTCRARTETGNWLAAVTGRYKLVVSPVETPWLMDLEADGDEVSNFFADPSRRDVLRKLARATQAYGKRYADPNVDEPAMKADLAWMAEGTGPYAPPARAGRRVQVKDKPPARAGRRATKNAPNGLDAEDEQ